MTGVLFSLTCFCETRTLRPTLLLRHQLIHLKVNFFMLDFSLHSWAERQQHTMSISIFHFLLNEVSFWQNLSGPVTGTCFRNSDYKNTLICTKFPKTSFMCWIVLLFFFIYRTPGTVNYKNKRTKKFHNKIYHKKIVISSSLIKTHVAVNVQNEHEIF